MCYAEVYAEKLAAPSPHPVAVGSAFGFLDCYFMQPTLYSVNCNVKSTHLHFTLELSHSYYRKANQHASIESYAPHDVFEWSGLP